MLCLLVRFKIDMVLQTSVLECVCACCKMIPLSSVQPVSTLQTVLCYVTEAPFQLSQQSACDNPLIITQSGQVCVSFSDSFLCLALFLLGVGTPARRQ